MVVGIIPFSSLYFYWISFFLFVSSIQVCIDSVIVSAYIIAFPLAFLAALPTTWIKLRELLKNPSLSASKMTIRLTSGISKPSLKRFIPTKSFYLSFFSW